MSKLLTLFDILTILVYSMNIQKTLEKIGLSQKQAYVYLALLDLGEGNMTDIAKKAGMKRPTVYLIIEELELLGLTASVLRGKKKIYSAAHPKRLSELTKFRAHQVEESMPELLARYGKDSEKPKVQMFEGADGVGKAYQEAYTYLSTKEEGLWLGNITYLKDRFPEILRIYNKMIKELKNPKIRELIYGGESAREWVDEMQSKLSSNHKIKYTPEANFGFTDQLIIGNKIIFFSFGEKVFVLIVENKELAQTQRALFEMAWKLAK